MLTWAIEPRFASAYELADELIRRLASRYRADTRLNSSLRFI